MSEQVVTRLVTELFGQVGHKPFPWKLTGKNSLTSLDDLPEVARLAARQRFLTRWYHGVAFLPFVVFVIIDFKFSRACREMAGPFVLQFQLWKSHD